MVWSAPPVRPSARWSAYLPVRTWTVRSPAAWPPAMSVVASSPRPVWARVCYTIGPSDSTVSVYAQTRNEEPRAFEIAWGGCSDVFGTSIWIGNPHGQPVGGHYGVAPATPLD